MALHHRLPRREYPGRRIIRGAAAGVPAGERPLVWFSSRQLWEPTATKGIVVNGVRRDATMQEMMAERGLWRFGISVSELLPWKALREQGNIGADTARDLIRAARRVGADPSFGTARLRPWSLTDV